MKAVYIESHGGPEVLKYGERPKPSLQPHEVKVRVRAAAINRLDTYVRAGVRGQKRQFPPPHILGGDCAGEVVEVGSHVSTVKTGQRAVVNPRISCGACPYCLAGDDDLCPNSKFMGSAVNGSYAEYVIVPVVNVHPIAASVSFEEAAAAPTVYLPMWNMLIRKTRLRPWETVLVLSASAGVGTAAIQVAKRVIGARVIATTSSPEKAARAKEIGADHVIDYSKEDFAARVKDLTGGEGVDVVVDHVGAQFFEAAYNSLKRGGRYGNCGVTTGYQVQLQMGTLFTRELQIFGVYMGSKEDMRQITAMLNAGKIKPVIYQVFPLERAADAHKAMESRGFFGKLVLKV
jgi:NADPH:quinone reductase-like Zn-dependent oxidoreductase